MEEHSPSKLDSCLEVLVKTLNFHAPSIENGEMLVFTIPKVPVDHRVFDHSWDLFWAFRGLFGFCQSFQAFVLLFKYLIKDS